MQSSACSSDVLVASSQWMCWQCSVRKQYILKHLEHKLSNNDEKSNASGN